tara:strand:+ start:1208 stop:2218 length:1011 start_codon:yes stop_codon:yes gene_type:complete
MKIAILFWGLTRSLKYTINSINKNIFDILKKNNIDYDIYLHTYKVNKLYTNNRSKEKNVKLDFNEYKLLNPKYFIYDDLDEIKNKLNFKLYRTHDDPWPEEQNNYKTLDNFILALYSKLQITNLLRIQINSQKNSKKNVTKINLYEKKIKCNNMKIEEINKKIKKYYYNINNKNKEIITLKITKLKDDITFLSNENKDLSNDSNLITGDYDEKKYDYVIFLRPDVIYLNNFDIKFFDKITSKDICIPNFCIFNNFNDRFFISNIENALLYGSLFNELLEYSKINNCHSETFHYNIIKKKYNLNINLVKFYFNRVRANGKILSNDYKSRRSTKNILE